MYALFWLLLMQKNILSHNQLNVMMISRFIYREKILKLWFLKSLKYHRCMVMMERLILIDGLTHRITQLQRLYRQQLRRMDRII